MKYLEFGVFMVFSGLSAATANVAVGAMTYWCAALSGLLFLWAVGRLPTGRAKR